MVANERLRGCMVAAQLTVLDVAAKVGVDPKTVERWITTGRVPHRPHRWATASLLRTDESFLWPEAIGEKRARSASEAELLALYPDRGAVPAQLWHGLIDAACEGIDILVFAGVFLPDGNPQLAKVLASKAKSGAKVRLALGDPDCDAVRLRGAEERIGDGLAARIRLSLTYLEEAYTAPGVELRLHTTTLYNSIYRFDDDLLVNTHTYGAPAAQSPVMHLHRLPGGRLFDHYRSSFERVWELAQDRRP